jgi:hypothetical protein
MSVLAIDASFLPSVHASTSQWRDHNTRREVTLLKFLPLSVRSLVLLPLPSQSSPPSQRPHRDCVQLQLHSSCKMAQKTVSKPGQKPKKYGHFAPKTTATQGLTQVQKEVQVQSTTISQDTTVQTSVEVVQTLTQAVVSSMAKLRHLFEDDNYVSKLIDMPDPKKSGKALRFDSLKRGITSRADRLLDWVVCCPHPPAYEN